MQCFLLKDKKWHLCKLANRSTLENLASVFYYTMCFLYCKIKFVGNNSTFKIVLVIKSSLNVFRNVKIANSSLTVACTSLILAVLETQAKFSLTEIILLVNYHVLSSLKHPAKCPKYSIIL